VIGSRVTASALHSSNQESAGKVRQIANRQHKLFVKRTPEQGKERVSNPCEYLREDRKKQTKNRSGKGVVAKVINLHPNHALFGGGPGEKIPQRRKRGG